MRFIRVRVRSSARYTVLTLFGSILASTLCACAGDDVVEASDQELRGGNPYDVVLDSLGRVVDDPRQWARDASVVIPSGCSATLVSPRVVLTAAHCVSRLGSAATVQFSPRNPFGDSIGTVPPGTPGAVSVNVIACATDPDSGLSCGGGGVVFVDRDVAALVLDRRVDVGPYGVRPSVYPVIPARVVTDDPWDAFHNYTDPSFWNGTLVRHVGYGRVGLLDDHHERTRQVAIQSVFSNFVSTMFLEGPEQGFAGDSGGGVLLDKVDDGDPLQLLAVFRGGTGSQDHAVRLTWYGVQQFLAQFLGPKDEGYPGTMVDVSGMPVWTGDVDVPPIYEPGRAGWRDPETGQTAAEVDPDGDGLRGLHDNCWGIYNPEQVITDPSLTRSCRSISTGGTFAFGCVPPTPDGVEASNDADGDGVFDACDNCALPNPDQRDRDGDGVGDFCRCGDPRLPAGAPCDVNSDGDTIPDSVDNCPTVANEAQRNCNADAELEVGSPVPVLGDACDPTACVAGSVETTHTSAGLLVDRVRLDPTGTTTASFHTGFRFCPCSIAANNSPVWRTRCERALPDGSGGCAIADPTRYPATLATERRDYRIPTLVARGRLDSAGEADLVHDLRVAIALEADWDLSAVDRPRWNLAFPGAYPASLSPLAPVNGVFWVHTMRPTGGALLPFDERRLTSHYWSGAAGITEGAIGTPLPTREARLPALPILPFSIGNGFCPACGDELPVPWVVLPCLDDSCSSPAFEDPKIAVGDLLLSPGSVPAFDPPGFPLLAGQVGVRWAAAPEERSALPEGVLRFVALGAGDPAAIARLLSAPPDGLSVFGTVACEQCDPLPFIAAAAADEIVVPFESPTPRSEYALAVSSARSSAWIAGGQDGSGELHDLWAYGATTERWTRVAVEGVALGRVRALAYAPDEDALYLLDEEAGWIRLINVPPFGGVARVVERWAAPRLPDVLVLAADSDAHLWIGASRERETSHGVARLTRSNDGACHADGFAIGPGALLRDGAFANSRGLSVAVLRRRGMEVVGYSEADLRPRGGPERCF